MSALSILAEECELLNDSKYRSYITQIEKALKSFDSTSEWADLISALGKLNKVSFTIQFTHPDLKLTNNFTWQSYLKLKNGTCTFISLCEIFLYSSYFQLQFHSSSIFLPQICKLLSSELLLSLNCSLYKHTRLVVILSVSNELLFSLLCL